MTNLLSNANFSAGWTDVPVPGIGTINQEPDGWVLAWMEKGAYLESAGAFADFDHTPVITRATCIPECVHKLSLQLPESQRLGGSDALILAGDAVYKVFSNYGSYSADLYQHVDHLTPGATVRLTAPLRPHYNPFPGGDGSPGACAALVWIEDADGIRVAQSEWLSFEHGVADRQWATIELSATVPTYGGLLIGATFESRSEAGIDWFTDAWRLEYVDEPEPEPEPTTCRGTPREQYARVYWLLPQTATEAQAAQVLKLAYPTRGTVGFSADDAGLGDLDSRDVRVMWFSATDWDRDALDAFFARDYPGTNAIHELLYTPPVEPEPEPGEEPQHPDPGVLIGLHSQLPKTGWLDFYRHVKPAIFKAVDQLGMCIEAKDASPDTLVVFRRHVTDDAYWFNQPDKRAAARAFLDLYSASFEAHARNTGMSLSDVLTHVDVVESVNEVIGTYDQDLEPSVAFEVAFMEAVAERYGNALHAGILTIAVGNPHESEFVKLLPAARAAAERGHYLGYHPYWAANRDVSYLLPHWTAHAGRWQAMDAVFRTRGVYPLWYGGEAGVVYSEDGWTLHSGLGWKACGSFTRYITELLTFQNHTRIWNREHGNRFRGATVFCYGGYGWDNFDFEPGDLSELAAAL